MMRRGIIPVGMILATSCSSPTSALNKQEIEAQIAKCGLKFSAPVWETREGRRTALKLTVEDLDAVSDSAVRCVTKVSIAHDIETQLGAGGGQSG